MRTTHSPTRASRPTSTMKAVMTILIGRSSRIPSGPVAAGSETARQLPAPARSASWRACPGTRSASGRAAASSAPRSPTPSRGATRWRTSRRPRWSPRCSSRGVRHLDVHRASERLARRYGRWPLSDARARDDHRGRRPAADRAARARGRLRARLPRLAADGRAAAGRGCAGAAPARLSQRNTAWRVRRVSRPAASRAVMRSVKRTGRERSRNIRRPFAFRRTAARPDRLMVARAMVRPRARTVIRTLQAVGQLTRTSSRRCRRTVARERFSSRTRGDPAGDGGDGVAAGVTGAAGGGGSGGPGRKLSSVEWPAP